MSKQKSFGAWDSGIDYLDSKYTTHEPCHKSHKPIPLGGGVFIGGSCSNPRAGADVYIGFDWSMHPVKTRPWKNKSRIEQVFFQVDDMRAPEDPEEYRELVNWTAEQLAQGKTVHAGCIGGHGRTGMFLAALLSVVNDDKDAIKTVREIYCHKAVETHSQIEFLHKHFGIKKVKATKGYSLKSTPTVNWPTKGAKEIKDGQPFAGSSVSWKPIKSHRSIIGALV